jgi:hypothetical protein
MSKNLFGSQDNTAKAKEKINLQFFADEPAPAPAPAPIEPTSLLGGDPDPAPEPGADPKTADPAANPEPKPGDPPKDPAAPDPNKPKEPDKPAGAPETYEAFKLPEGTILDEAINTEFKGLAKEANLSQEAAQKFLDLEIKHFQNQNKVVAENWNKTTNDWAEQTKKDLGPNFQEELKYAAKFIDQIGGPELGKAVKQFLNQTKMGNHPLFAKLFIAAGKAISEDKLEVGGKGKEKLDARKMYPKSDMNP